MTFGLVLIIEEITQAVSDLIIGPCTHTYTHIRTYISWVQGRIPTYAEFDLRNSL